MSRRWILVSALCCIAAVVACGGDDESTPESPESRIKADWVKRVNATCRQGNAEARRIVAQVRKEKLSALAFTAESLARIVHQAVCEQTNGHVSDAPSERARQRC